MTKIQKIKIILVTCLLSFVAVPAFAAEIFFDAKTREVAIGEQFEVNIFLNTEEEYINAVEGKVIFPENLLELKEIRDGATIVNFWIERPKIKSGPEGEQVPYGASNQIAFSGIIPGGYAGEKGLIFSAIFRVKNEGEGIIEIQEAKTLLNDGKGTEASLSISNLQFLISEEIPPSLVPPTKIIDIDPPESFEPIVAQDPEIFDGKYFLVFLTQDKGSGIDYYEVCEGKRQCVVAESPYLLQNQSLDREIIVKAIDKSGNERIVTLPAQKPAIWYKNYLILAIIILVIAIAYLMWKFLWRKNRR